MALNIVAPPYPVFTDRDGTPLENGYVYLGVPGQDAETNPIQVFWDESLTIPAVQPIRTVYGYLSQNGTPAKLYANRTFSITVKNVNQEVVFSALSNVVSDPTAGRVDVETFTGDGTTTQFTMTAPPITENNTQVYINGVYQNKDGYSLSGAVLTFSEAPPAAGSHIEVVSIENLVIGEADASNVQYIPSAGIATTVQAKLRETVSVKDFGAVGDGVTDDTAAIQAAIKAVGDNDIKKLYFPAGTYLCELTSGIGVIDTAGNVINNFCAVGAGKGATVLKLGLNSNQNYQSFFNCTSIDGLEISGMTFDFNELRPASRISTSERFHNPAILVQGENSKNVYIHDCAFINMYVDQPVRLAGFKSDTTLIDADFIDGVRLENLNFIKGADAVPNNTFQEDLSAIYMFAKNVQITNCRFDTQIPLATLGATGRGRTAIEAYGYNYNISDCQFRRWRRAHIIGTYPRTQSADFFTRNWNLSGNNYRQNDALIDVAYRIHIYGPIKFSNNIVTHGESHNIGLHAFFGFGIAGGSTPIGEYNDAFVISDNFFDFAQTAPATANSYFALMNFQNAPRVVFSGNTLMNHKGGVIYAEARTGDDPNFATGYVVHNNYFYNICTDAANQGRNDGRPIWLETASVFGDMIITNNTWENIGIKGSRTSSNYNGNIFAGLFSLTGTNLVVANNVIKGANSAFNANATYTGTWTNRVDQNNINVAETD